jgi:methyl-accepting chemotaxis protein
MVKRLRNALEGTRDLGGLIDRLEAGMSQMVLAARIELGKAGPSGEGLKAVVDAIEELAGRVSTLRADVESHLRGLRSEVMGVSELVEDAQGPFQAANRLSRRAEGALSRIERDLGDVANRSGLLVEMAKGQSEIGGHIASQVAELSDLVRATLKVTDEQIRILG